MQIPAWLSAITGAANQMPGNGLDSFVSGTGPGPSMMDAARGIGHDMMTHFRAGQSLNPLAVPGATTAPGPPQVAPPPIAPPAMPPMQAPPRPMPVQGASFMPAMGGQTNEAPDLAAILASIGHGVAPHIPQGVPLDKVAIHFK